MESAVQRFLNLVDPEVTSLEALKRNWLPADSTCRAGEDDEIRSHVERLVEAVEDGASDLTAFQLPRDPDQRKRAGHFLSSAAGGLQGILIRYAFDDWTAEERPCIPPRELISEQVRRIRVLRDRFSAS
jgi:hypothetical protein